MYGRVSKGWDLACPWYGWLGLGFTQASTGAPSGNPLTENGMTTRRTHRTCFLRISLEPVIFLPKLFVGREVFRSDHSSVLSVYHSLHSSLLSVYHSLHSSVLSVYYFDHSSVLSVYNSVHSSVLSVYHFVHWNDVSDIYCQIIDWNFEGKKRQVETYFLKHPK
jgi:hypothetical protein